jgi:hypothetical protein
MLQGMACHLRSRRLYIADLARRLYEMESGDSPIQPLAFRLVAKRLRDALAGLPPSVARAGFAELPEHLMPLLSEMFERRHFDQHGRLLGDSAVACRDQAEALFSRLKRPPAS